MKLATAIHILIATSMLVLPACAPQNTYKARQFGGQNVFIETSEAKVVASPEAIANALLLKDKEKYTTPEQLAELNLLIKETALENFQLTDPELNLVDRAQPRGGGFVTIDPAVNIQVRVKPLVIGMLYQIEIARENSKVAIPGIILRKDIYISKGNIEAHSDEESQNQFEELSKKNIEVHVVRIYGRNDLVTFSEVFEGTEIGPATIAPRPQVLGKGFVDEDGLLTISAQGSFRTAHINSFKIKEANTLLEAQLFNEDVIADMSDGSNLKRLYAFGSRYLQLNVNDIKRIKESLTLQKNFKNSEVL